MPKPLEGYGQQANDDGKFFEGAHIIKIEILEESLMRSEKESRVQVRIDKVVLFLRDLLAPPLTKKRS
jgi:hypothetical protein